MAVVACYEKAGSPGPLRESASGFSITREFIVRTNSRADDAIVVDGAVGLPQRGNIYQTSVSTHPYLFCMERSFRRINDKSKNWVVECEYRTPDPNNKEEQQQQVQAPEFELPIIRTGSSSELRDVVKTVDATPKAIVNALGQPFRPHPKKEVPFPTLFIQRNEPVTAPIGRTQLAYIGKLNSDTFWGLAAGQWKCVSIQAELASRVLLPGVQRAYLVVSYEFHAKDSWALEILHTGTKYLSGGVKIPFGKDTGVETEGMLTPTGGDAGTTPYFLTFDVYEQVPFAALNLPQSMIAAVPR